MKGWSDMGNVPRRAIMWSAPIAVVSCAAPAMAVSKDPEISGLLEISYYSSYMGNSRIAMTTSGRSLGFFVMYSATAPSSATITVYIDSDIASSSTAWRGSGNGWSTPRYVGMSGGMAMFETTFSGTWTSGAGGVWTAPTFSWEARAPFSRNRHSVRVVRKAVVSGVTYTTDTGNETIGSSAAARGQSTGGSDGGGSGDQKDVKTL